MSAANTGLTHNLPQAMTQAIEGNMLAFFDALAAVPGAQQEHTSMYRRWTNAGILNPMFNGAAGLGGLDSTIIQDTLDYFKQQATPYSFWWILPSDQRVQLAEIYAQHNLIPFEIDAPGMAVELDKLPADGPVPPSFTMTQVEDESGLRQWARTFVEGFDVPEWAGQSWVDASLRVGVRQLPWQMYVGWLGDKPVGVAMTYCGGGAAGLFALAVSPQARGQGLGAALTVKPLLEARAQGYRVGTLFSTEMGLPLYERLGFKTYCTISRYLWRQG